MYRVIHFELPVDDVERASKFYANVFGWDIQAWGGEEYYLAATGMDDEPGIDGALLPRSPDLSHPTMHIEVPSVDETLEHVTQSKGEIVRPRAVIPGVGYVAYVRDPEGNVVGVFQECRGAG